jgi:DNA-3-methyladenine glycosylase
MKSVSSAPLRLRVKNGFSLLPRKFYVRHPRIVARALLGKILLRRHNGAIISGRIVETEAYLGDKDLAAHSAAGKTPRNEVMFGPAGHCYVYFTYGMHFCANVSCDKEGYGGAVLFRALEPLEGVEQMALWRKLKLRDLDRVKERRLLTSGPGRMAQALNITRPRDNGKDFTSADSDLIIVDEGGMKRASITTTTRIGITKSADLHLRFYLTGNEYVSGRRP